jgi:purine nucleosidase
MGEPPRRVVLDTDLAMGAEGANVDDGFALALAVADPAIELELVTTTHGNIDVVTATRLARELLGVLGRPDVAVVRGAPGPLDPRKRRDGRDPAPPPDDATPRHAASELVSRVMAAPGEVTVVALGPLTNVALALLLEPSVASLVREVVVMGGVYLETTNVARRPGESNFWADPDAAEVVLRSGAPLRLVGLDVTRRVRLSRADAARLTRQDRSFARMAGEATEAWIAHRERTTPDPAGNRDSCALHDPLAVAVVTHPQLVTWQPAHVSVETASRTTRGVAVADLLGSPDPPEPNCELAVGVDAAAFRRLFLHQMASLP